MYINSHKDLNKSTERQKKNTTAVTDQYKRKAKEGNMNTKNVAS